MYFGKVKRGEVITIAVPTHKFTTGEKFDGTVTGYYLKMGADFGTKINITLALIPGETGLYYKDLDTTSHEEGTYFVVIKAVINTINAQMTGNFEIEKASSLYGRATYGNSMYS